MKLFFEKDVKSELLKNEVIAVIGFGPMGKAFALNLRDSGHKVIIGLRKKSKNIANAHKENLKVLSVEEAVKNSKVICMLCSDTSMKEVYQIIKKAVKENEKKVLCFAHGFAISYGLIKPEKNFDVVLLAPKGTGKAVRENFTNDKGTFALLGIYQNYSGMALNYALELAKALKFLKKGLLMTTFENETITDIFGEQTVLCGGISQLIKYAYETLVEKGYPKELAYLEVMHELKFTVELIHEKGLSGLWRNISYTAKFGSLKNRERVIDLKVKKNMLKILEEIESEKFAKELLNEYKNESKTIENLIRADESHDIEIIGKKLRKYLF